MALPAAWPSALIAAYDPPAADSGQATMCPTLQNFYIELGATSIREMNYLRQPGTDQDKHIRYVKSRRFQKRVEVLSRGIMKCVEKRVGHSISQSDWSCEQCQVAPSASRLASFLFFRARRHRACRQADPALRFRSSGRSNLGFALCLAFRRWRRRCRLFLFFIFFLARIATWAVFFPRGFVR